MCEILFRGKRTDNGEWVEGRLLADDVIVPKMQEFIINCNDIICRDGLVGYIVDIQTIGRYTGLTDKNGRKIFEGDILCMATETNEKIFFTVNFGEYNDDNALDDDHFIGWYLSCKLDEDDKTVNVSILNGQSDGMPVIKMSEIVGNIYDNRKLLEESASD